MIDWFIAYNHQILGAIFVLTVGVAVWLIWNNRK